MPNENIDTIERTSTKEKVARPKLWTVKFYNDDFTPMDFVIAVLRALYNQSPDEAAAITMQVHKEGAAVVGVFTKDIAETKAERTIMAARENRHPLKVEAVPA
jgi:ATP-dependent Clp protease adaptor protein ClpS